MNKTVKNPRQPAMGRPMQKVKKGTFPRFIKLLFSFYKAPLILVIVCICLNAAATACPSIFQEYVVKAITELVQNNMDLVAVTLNCNTSADRFKECMELFNYGFSKLEAIKVPEYSVEIGFGFQKTTEGYDLQAKMNSLLEEEKQLYDRRRKKK